MNVSYMDLGIHAVKLYYYSVSEPNTNWARTAGLLYFYFKFLIKCMFAAHNDYIQIT